MKKIVKFAMVLFVALTAVACSNNDNIGDEYLDVTPNNISGTWKMESFDNGMVWPEGVYYYITFNRKERSFVSYDNTDSMGEMGAVRRSGKFDIVTNESAVIYGVFDYGGGDWEYRFYVRELTKDRMVWVAVNDANIVQVYVRAELPEWLPKDEDKK